VAGVSAKTVSRVLNQEPGVAAATAARIQAAIATLGFRRNEMARMLRTGDGARALGLVVHDLDTPHSAGVAGAVARAARDQGFLVITGSSHGDPGSERQLVSWLLGRQVDGLLLMPSGDGHDYLSAELQRGLPVVLVDSTVAGIEVDCVVIDNVDGARQATHHLLRHGHRRIAFIGDRPGIPSADQRLDGHQQALATGGIWVDAELIRTGLTDLQSAQQATQQLLALKAPPTAILAAGSWLALGAARALERSGTALVGFDDLELADLSKTPLTTVSCAAAGIGSSAASLLLARLAGSLRPAQKIVLPAVLSARGSGERRPDVGPQPGVTRRWYRRS